MKFKVGDKVRQKGSPYPSREGLVGKICGVFEPYQNYRYDVIFSDGEFIFPYRESELEFYNG